MDTCESLQNRVKEIWPRLRKLIQRQFSKDLSEGERQIMVNLAMEYAALQARIEDLQKQQETLDL